MSNPSDLDTNGQVVALDPGASRPRTVATGQLGRFTVSPDGTRVAVQRFAPDQGEGRSVIEVRDRATGRVLLSHSPAPRAMRLLGWTATGIVLTHPGGSSISAQETPDSNVYVIDIATGGPIARFLTVFPPQWGATSEQLLVSGPLDLALVPDPVDRRTGSGDTSQERTHLVVTDLAHDGRQVAAATLPGNLGRGAVTPDGTRFLVGPYVLDARTLTVRVTLPMTPVVDATTPVWDTGLISSAIVSEEQPDGADVMRRLWYTCT